MRLGQEFAMLVLNSLLKKKNSFKPGAKKITVEECGKIEEGMMKEKEMKKKGLR